MSRRDERLTRDTEVDSVATLFLWLRGGAVGGLAFLVGVGLVYFLLRGRFAGEAGLAVSALGRWRVSAWVYYNAHLVPTDGVALDALSVVAGGGNTLFWLAAEEPLFYGLFLLPPALLVVAGYRTAKRRPKNTRWPRAGVAVAVGYCFVAAVFLIVASIQPAPPAVGVPAGTEVGPNPWLTVGLAALAYPAVFGLLGALLGRRAPWTRPSQQRRDRQRRRP
ncbi:hypothetical protein [Haloarchaeobius litoreus]|uniref:DUF7978 domain-containing protein n=1 Tax=Haloarchaeobius litoreus TaxID=755306 RepID=A0ABD6DED0_9EURY|nr:hypothetical protein [Haloarchaeobius litoreus]